MTGARRIACAPRRPAARSCCRPSPGACTATARPARSWRSSASLPARPVALAPAVGRGDAPVLQLVRPARAARPQRLPDLRPPDVGAAARRGGVSGVRGRRSPRSWPPCSGRSPAAAATTTLAPEVPGPPADVALPEATVAGRADEDAAAADDAASTDEDGDDRRRATHDTEETRPPADGHGRRRRTPSGGTAAPEAEADGPTNDTAPPADSEAEQFEDFCAQNPGAC